MADSHPLAGLLDQAQHLLHLVGELADALGANEHSPGEETQPRVAAAWKALLPAIVETGATLPSEPSPIADWIREVGRVAQRFDEAVRHHGLTEVLFSRNCDGFLRVANEGQILLREMTPKRSPFAFVDAPAAEANGGATKAIEPAPNTGGASAPADGNKYDVPQIDEYDDRVAWWIGKRIYLGRDTQVARLFWLLAKPVGRAHTLAEVQRAVEGMETNANAGSTPEEIEKAAKRLRKVVSKLKAAMREAELDDHFVIHRGGSQREPEYSLVPRFQ